MNKKRKEKKNQIIRINKQINKSPKTELEVPEIMVQRRRQEEKAKEKKKQKTKTPPKIIKLKKSKLKLIIIYVLIFIISLGIIYIIFNRQKFNIVFNSIVEEKDGNIINLATDIENVYSFNKEILIYSKGKLITYNRFGKKTWEYGFEEMFYPKINIAGNYIQVTNMDNSYVYLFQNKYEVLRKKIDGSILDIELDKSGKSIVHYSKAGIKSMISIYNQKGKEISSIKLPTENISNIILAQNGRYLAYNELNLEGVTIESNIKLVDLTKTNHIIEIDNLATEIISDMSFENNKMAVITTDRILRYSIEGKKELDKVLNKNLVYMDMLENKFIYIEKQSNNLQENKLAIQDIKTGREKSSKTTTDIRDMRLQNGLIYLTNPKKIEIYSIMLGKKIKEYISSSVITKPIVFNYGKNVAVVYSNKIVLFGV